MASLSEAIIRNSSALQSEGILFLGSDWQDELTAEDTLAMRFPSAGALLSTGELERGPFLPCAVTEASEVVVTAHHAYDLTIGKECRAAAMQAYVKYLKRAGEQDEPGLNWHQMEQAYNSAMCACRSGIPQARMAEDLSNLRRYWLPKLIPLNMTL